METIETIEYRGFNINIHPDFDPIDPIENFDMLGTMVCWHSRYNLGHEHKSNPDEFLQELAIEADHTIEDTLDYWENGTGWIRLLNKYGDEMGKTWSKASEESDRICKQTIKAAIAKHYITLPLYLYDHSGITISTSPFHCPWDSGQVGFIYVSIAHVKKEWGWKYFTKSRRQKIIDTLVSEVNCYDNYLTGAIYGYTVEPTDRNKSIECDDSCWGYYGYDHEKSGLLSDAKSNINYAIEEYKEKCKQNHQRRLQMNSFMDCCWAY